MSTTNTDSSKERTDRTVLDLLCRVESVTVGDLAREMGVTATAVRQRLNRLMGQRMIERSTVGSGRGRPSHQYRLTEKGRRSTGQNFTDLALALWKEIRDIPDAAVRKGLLGRIACTLAETYAPQMQGMTPAARMLEIKRLFAEKNIPFSVDESQSLPILTAHACPYPDLAEKDREICTMEKKLFSNLLMEDVKLTACRLDGANCCTFEMN